MSPQNPSKQRLDATFQPRVDRKARARHTTTSCSHPPMAASRSAPGAWRTCVVSMLCALLVLSPPRTAKSGAPDTPNNEKEREAMALYQQGLRHYNLAE